MAPAVRGLLSASGWNAAGVGLPQNRIHELDIDMAMVVVRHNSLHQSERDGEAE